MSEALKAGAFVRYRTPDDTMCFPAIMLSDLDNFGNGWIAVLGDSVGDAGLRPICGVVGACFGNVVKPGWFHRAIDCPKCTQEVERLKRAAEETV